MRRAKPLLSWTVNGWLIEKCPNTFAEHFVYEATALTAEGHQAAKHGFQSKRDAVAFASRTVAPTTRVSRESADAVSDEADVSVSNEGSVFGFRPITETGRIWMDEKMAAEPWQWLGGILYIDHRYAQPIVEGMQEDGLMVA